MRMAIRLYLNETLTRDSLTVSLGLTHNSGRHSFQ